LNFCVCEIQNGSIFNWGKKDVKIQLEFRKNDESVASTIIQGKPLSEFGCVVSKNCPSLGRSTLTVLLPSGTWLRRLGDLPWHYSRPNRDTAVGIGHDTICRYWATYNRDADVIKSTSRISL